MSVVAILPVIMTPFTIVAMSVASAVAPQQVNVCHYKEGSWSAVRISENEFEAYKGQYKAFGYLGPTNPDGEPDHSKCNEWCAQNAPKDREKPVDKPVETPKEEIKETPKETPVEQPVQKYEAPKPAETVQPDIPDTTGK